MERGGERREREEEGRGRPRQEAAGGAGAARSKFTRALLASSQRAIADGFADFPQTAVAVWHGPPDGSPTQTHQFRDTVAEHSTPLIVRGQIIGCGRSGMVIDGSIAATGSIACAASMAHRKGPFVGSVPGGFAGQIKQAADAARAAVEAIERMPASAPSIAAETVPE